MMTSKYNDLFIGWNPNINAYQVWGDDNDVIEEIKVEDLKPTRYRLDFGEYKGLTLDYIFHEDPNYIKWLKTTDDILLKQCINNL